MSIVTTRDVFCDGVSPKGHRCPDWAEGCGSTDDAAIARWRARTLGWKRRGSVDLCPRCVELGWWPR